MIECVRTVDIADLDSEQRTVDSDSGTVEGGLKVKKERHADAVRRGGGRWSAVVFFCSGVVLCCGGALWRLVVSD